MSQSVTTYPRLHAVQTAMNEIRMEQAALRTSQSINGSNLDLLSDQLKAAKKDRRNSDIWYGSNMTHLREEMKVMEDKRLVSEKWFQKQLDQMRQQRLEER
jgi:hypothetical protein